MWNVLLWKQKQHRLEEPVSRGGQSASQGRLSQLLQGLVKPNSNQSQPGVYFQILTSPADSLWRVCVSIAVRDESPSLLPARLCQVLPGCITLACRLCSARSWRRRWSYRADASNSRRNTSLLRRVHLCWIMSSVSLRTELLLYGSQRRANEDAALGASYGLSYTSHTAN